MHIVKSVHDGVFMAYKKQKKDYKMFLVLSTYANSKQTVEEGVEFSISQTSQKGVGATTRLWMCKTTRTQEQGSPFAMYHYGRGGEFKTLCTAPRKSAKLVSTLETKLKEMIQKCPKGLEEEAFYNFCRDLYNTFSI